MKKVILLVLLLFVLSAVHTVAQDNPKPKSGRFTKEDKGLYETANGFYKDGNFIRALAIYKVLTDNYPENAELKYKTGICYIYKTDEKGKAIELITAAGNLNPKLEDYNYNLGRAYHANYKFQEAIPYFENYLKENPSTQKKNLAEHYLEYCKNGETAATNRTNMIIENIGPPVNTENSEYVPILNADQSILIFTYIGEKSTGGLMDAGFNPAPDGQYYEDVFISYKIGEKWTDPQSIGENINTKGHDASIALSFDGQKLFIFKSTPQDKGDIYVSQLKGDVWGKPERLGPTINTNAWEGSVSMSTDEQQLYFASERPGGFGGRDIYRSQKQANGEWGPAVNLGEKINTKYDEDAPFIHSDGTTLFFSSKGHTSIGGYDIFSSSNKSGEWSEPQNMGMPLNTTDDDLYYVLTPDGETGYYSSDRKEGYGQQDIYVVTPGLPGNKPVLALSVGQVLSDSVPVEASIKVMNMENGEVQGDYKSNSTTGKYAVALPASNNYKLAIEVEGLPPHYEYINVKTLDSYVTLQQDIHLYTDTYMKAHHIDSIGTANLQKKLDEQLKKYVEERNPEVYEARKYKDLLKKTGYLKKDSVTYDVDLGTYQTASDFNPSKFSDLGKIDSVKNANGSTTFHIAGFNTMDDAENIRKKVITKDSTFNTVSQLTVNDKGKDRLLQDYYAAYYAKKDYTVPTEPTVIKTRPNPIATESVPEVVTSAKPGSATISSTKPQPVIKETATKAVSETKTEARAKAQKETRKTEETSATTTTASAKEEGTPCESGKTYDFSALAGKSLNDPATYNLLMNIAGSMCVEGMTFKVQVGAYHHPENFKYNHLKGIGRSVDRYDAVGDGITRFITGEFNTLKDTEKLRQKIIALGTRDAWIVATYKGKRMTLEELIPLGFYSKGIN